jgi:DNA-binding MarR family transcriptional regulator
VQLSLTPLGRVRAEKLEQALNAHAAQVFDSIPAEKHAQIMDSLAILFEALNKHTVEANSE